MSPTSNATVVSLPAFDAWASIYDQQNNPMLALEEHHIEALLPSITRKDVFEAGCGTGRWLEKLAAYSPASLTGIDASPAMLDRAKVKLGEMAQLHLGDCTSLPAENDSVDVLVSSFVLSYLEDLHGFALECARVVRAGGTILLSDLNPDTASAMGWRRGFRCNGEQVELSWFDRSLALIVATFEQVGFRLRETITPSFGEAERAVFAQSGKLAEYEELRGVPAIYILKLQKQEMPLAKAVTRELQLVSACVAASLDTTVETTVQIAGGRFGSLATNKTVTSAPILDLSGYLVLPGLINAHDHLEFALFPKLGRDTDEQPYRNALEWSHEIHTRHAEIIALHRRVPKSTRLWWGAIRNLLSGVTTVCHHNPVHPDFAHPEFPVRIVSNFRWSHSLALDPNLLESFHSTPLDAPFVLHAAEGLDRDARNEVARLEEMGVLDSRTVLVHGLALSDADADLLNRRDVGVIACPTSNEFLFHRSPSCDRLHSIRRVALGSDSPLTAAGDLLDEIRYAHEQTGLSAAEVYGMVTDASAGMLRLRDGEGRIVESGVADLIAVRTSETKPAAAVAQLRFDEIELVMIGGKVQVASLVIYERLPEELRVNMQLLSIGGHLRWVRAPLDFLFSSAEEILGKDNLRLGGKEVRRVTAL